MRNARKLDMGKLIAFVTVCEEGSITAASRKLGIAQPALTIALTKLEQSLEGQLLHRESRGTYPTALGKLLLSRAYEILGLAEMTYREVCNDAANPEGDVTIGLPSSTTAVLAAPFVIRFSREFPRIRLRVVEGFSGYLWDWLAEGKIDVAIVFDRQSSTEAVCENFAYEDLHLVGSRGLVHKREVGVNDLPNYPLVMPSKIHSIRALLDEHMARFDLFADVQLEMDSGQALIKLVEMGNWFSILAPASVSDQVRKKTLQTAVITPRLTRAICMARHREKLADQAVSRVCTELKREGQQLIADRVWDARLV